MLLSLTPLNGVRLSSIRNLRRFYRKSSKILHSADIFIISTFTASQTGRRTCLQCNQSHREGGMFLPKAHAYVSSHKYTCYLSSRYGPTEYLTSIRASVNGEITGICEFTKLNMPIVYVKDRGGQTATFRESCGVLLTPAYPEGILDDVPKIKMREDDIIIASWMRSGTHWVWEMTNMLLKNSAETIPDYKEAHMFEGQSVKALDALSSPRVLNTHLRLHSLPKDLKTKKCRVIFLQRNPRDAMVSWYKLMLKHEPFEYKGEWCNFLPTEIEGKFDWGSWIDHTRHWEKVFETHPNLNVHIWYYEDMIKKPIETLRKLSEFLETSTDESFLKAVVEKCHIDRMRQDKKKFEIAVGGDLHYMKGQSGTWKEQFTVEQYEYYEKIYREAMAGSKFEERYKGPVDVL